MHSIISVLLASDEPIIRYKTLAHLSPAEPAEVEAARQAMRSSPHVLALLASRAPDGTISLHPYQKWQGAHWVLGQLADIEYPPCDTDLIPLRDQVFSWLFSPEHEIHIRLIEGRVRRCASQEGNALYAALMLGIADARAEELASRLMRWQWPDGGWNCDKRPAASHASFHETFFAMRALNLYASLSGDARVRQAALQAAEMFLQRRLYLRLSTGEVIDPQFTKLHYPNYWYYDILIGLRILNEIGLLNDPRCRPALELLLSKRLPDGGFPAEGKHYQVTTRDVSGKTPLAWGLTSSRKSNPFVTVEALRVLKSAGML